jgi:PKD repeat protein
MKKSALLLFAMAAVMSVGFLSCKDSTPPAPTAVINATIDGYTVAFDPTVTDASTYEWNFGDGGSSTEAKPTHTYASSGIYNVTLVVTGEGGEVTATKEITIAASFMEMLTGGESAADGKTWVLSRIVTPGDGSGAVISDMTADNLYSDNFLDDYSLGDEYDNEFTFYSNGDYSINPVNGNVLAGEVYGVLSGYIQGDPAVDIRMCAASFDPPSGAKFEIHNNEDLIVNAITDPETTDIPPLHENVIFTGKTWISLSEGAYFGILDYPTTAKFIIKSITLDKLQVALFLCGYSYGDMEDIELPTNLIQFTYIPKSSE